MRYSKYGLFDFVEDEAFQNWVMSPNKDSDFFWESFMANHHNKVDTIAKAKEIILSIGFKENLPEQGLEEELFNNILQEKHSKINLEKPIVDDEPNLIRLFINKFNGMAAVFIVLLVSFSVWMYLSEKTDFPEETAIPISYIERSLKKGQRVTYKLPDGTNVKLNAGSYIKFPKTFNGNKREVVLEGEAYFDVSHNPSKPFYIHTGELCTKVLGTSFNINYKKQLNILEVAVETGLVSVLNTENHNNQQGLLLKPEQMAIIEKDKKPVKTRFDYQAIFGWKNGLLILEESALPEIFEKLEKWYGLEFIYPEDIKHVAYSGGKFDNKPLKEVLDGLSYSLKFNYSIQNNKVMITTNE